MNQTKLCHFRLGHTNLDRIHRLVTSEHLGSLDVAAFVVYEPCLEGEMTMRPFQGKKVKRANVVLDLVHIGSLRAYER